MTFKKVLFSTITSLAVLSMVPLASAADYDSNAPIIYGTETDWNGFYAGVMGGFDSAKYDDGSTDFGLGGAGGGIFGGVNIEEGGLLYGLDARLNLTTLDKTSSGITASIPWNGDVRARIGVVYGDTLVYGAAGIAFANMKVTDVDGSDSNTHMGWTVGVGGEQNLGGPLFARAEYSYSDYFDTDYNTGGGSFEAGPDNQHQLKIGLGIRF